MEQDLVSIYETHYLNTPVIEEKKFTAAPSDEDDADDNDECPSPPTTKKSMKRKKSKENIGGITYDSHNRSESVFDKILREMDEMGGAGDSEDVYDGGEDVQDEYTDDSISLSELRNMTLGDLINLLGSGQEEDVFDDGTSVDEIPSESVEGGSVHLGNQGNYSGKATRQPATNRVKANGDAIFSDTDTGYDPEDTEGGEAEEMGAQGNYDGKAKRQPSTNHVKANGDADFKGAKTSYRTSTGKKPKNYF